jgi:comEA protein
MKRYTALSVGLLVFMLTLGGMAYGQGGMDSSTSGSGQSSGSGTMGSDQGMGGTSGSAGSSSGMGSSSQSGLGSSSGQMQGQIDINTASAKELESVPGMTKSMAKNIVKYRDQNGPFASVDDLAKVKGINEKKLNELRSHLTVGAAGSQQQPMGGQGGTSGMGGEGAGGTSGGTSSGGMGGTGGDTSGGTGGAGTDTGGTGGMGTGGTSGSGSSSGSQY